LIALRFGTAAVRGALEAGEAGVMIALDPPNMITVPIAEAMGKMKQVPLESDSLQTARDLGILFCEPDE
jgi:6-phosphofructokinase 1